MDLGDYEFRCSEISCQWDEGRIKRWYFEKNCLLITVPLRIGGGFERVIANADDLFFGFVDRNPFDFKLLDFW